MRSSEAMLLGMSPFQNAYCQSRRQTTALHHMREGRGSSVVLETLYSH